MSKKKLAIVLSGGGAKGAYQAGVWYALKKMHIKYDIVTGTSIGALNGMMMVQNDFKKCIKIWKNVDFSYIYEDNSVNKLDNKDIYKKYLATFLTEGGIDTDKIKVIVKKLFNPIKFYLSSVDFGIVTYNLTDRKVENIKKKNTKKNNMIDFIVASAACYPAFKQKNINNNTYIDGGFYDNLPINLAIELGATDVIAVDLKAIGFKKKVKDSKVNIINIEPRNKIVSLLVFNKDESRRTMKLGYNDTMKTFNRLDGDKYTFRLNDLKVNYKRYGKKYIQKTKEILKHEKQNKSILEKIIGIAVFNKIISSDEGEMTTVVNNSIEFLGKIFKIDETKIYDIDYYNYLIIEALNDVKALDEKDIEKKIRTMDLNTLTNSSIIVKFIYNQISHGNISLAVATVFPKEFLASIYLYVITY